MNLKNKPNIIIKKTKNETINKLKEFRYYQQEANDAIYNELLINNKCLIKMFCGTGKSLLMRKCKSMENHNLVVYVFPSLSLIDQFYNDYLYDYDKEYILKISSESESTTDPDKIMSFLNKTGNKIICITYQSYKTLIENIGDIKINACIYDESHHIVGEKYQKLIFENERNICEKQIFLTATPKNSNGIIMYDRNNLDAGMCGKLVYDYSYLRGMNEGYLNPFEIRIDMYLENTNKSIYESISRAILVSGNNRVLTFHADVNTDRITSVLNFVNENEFKKAFDKVLINEFPEKKGYYTQIKMIALEASIKLKERRIILDNFDKTESNEIFIISSCETIGEGIDTKNANMCVFADPKTSYVKIIQNIGRIVRKQFGIYKPSSTILIPCWVDKEKYIGCDEDREKCDEVIRNDMNENGNFNGILNVLSALKQEDEDIYDICLHYPDTFSPQEIRSNLENQGFKVLEQVGDGELIETIEHLLDEEINYDDYEDCMNDEEMIMRIAEDNDVCIEIHTNSFENQVEKYNSECESGEVIRLYKEDEDEEGNQIYYSIVKKCGKKRNQESIKELDKKNRVKIDVHTNPDVSVLWKLVGDFTKEICSCVLECEVDVVDRWFERFEELNKFIDENKKRPNLSSNNNNEKLIARWFINNTMNYKNKNKGMLSETRYNTWSQFKEEYKEYFIDDEEKWIETLDKLKTFIDKNKRKPMNIDRHKSKNTEYSEENKLGEWVSGNQKCFNKKTFGMKNISRYNLWKTFLCDYSKYYKKNEDKWIEKFNNLKYFFDTNKKRPNKDGIILTEKKLGQWMTNQIKNHKNKLQKMKDEDTYNLWSNLMIEYAEYFGSDEDKWKNNLLQVNTYISINKERPSYSSYLGHWLIDNKQSYINKTWVIQERYKLWQTFIQKNYQYIMSSDERWEYNFNELIMFINSNKKTPVTSSIMGAWFANQKTHYKNKTSGMNEKYRYDKWTQFLEKYAEYLLTETELWFINFEKLKKYISLNSKLPNKRSCDDNEKKIGNWLSLQKVNYKNKTRKMKDLEIYTQWSQFLKEYNQYFDNIQEDNYVQDETEEIVITPKPKKSMKLKEPTKIEPNQTPEQKRIRTKSELSILHQRYKTLNSQNLQKEFKETPELWYKYHSISEENEKSFPEDEIPRNRIIQELNKLQFKRSKTIVDMGCGKAQIAEYFKDDKRFNFINYDHISSSDNIISCDISNIPDDDYSVEICILCLAMWGSNCHDYIKESNRILESGGKLYIIEATKRWSEEDENNNLIKGNEGNKLKTLLENNGFQITFSSIEKFCLFICVKK
jgi:superfamily II DNA or RNA helicase